MESQTIIQPNIIRKIIQFTQENPKNPKADSILITNNSQTISNIQNQIQQFKQDRGDNQCLERVSLSRLQYKQVEYQQIYKIIVKGRQNSHYQFRKIVCFIFFPDGYPIKAPVIYFNNLVTKDKKSIRFEHINVFSDGRLCQQIIQKLYKANISLSEILETLQNTLYNENPDSPANSALKTLKLSNINDYHKKMIEQSKLLEFVDEEDD